MRRVFNVRYRENEWILTEQGKSEAVKKFRKKKDAISYSRPYSKKRKPSELRIHKINKGLQLRHIYDEPNPFERPLRSFFDRLNLLNGLDRFLYNQLNIIKKKVSPHQNEVFSGSLIPFIDITKNYKTSFPQYYISGQFITRGKKYISTLDKLHSHEAGWCISQSYESFETYLYDSIALCFHKRIITDSKGKKTKFENKYYQNIRNPKTDLSYWSKFVRYRFRNEELFKEMRNLSRALERAEMNNNRKLNLQKWYVITTEVRHAVTHCNAVIKAKRMNNWDKIKKQLLSKYFTGYYKNNDYVLNLSKKDVEFNLRIFIEFAYQIFKYLSQVKGYKWEVFKRIN